MDVEASRAIRQAEVGAARTMIERGMDRFDLYPEHRAGDSAYGASEMVGCDYEGLAAPVMNSSLPPTAENLRKLAKLRPKLEPTAALA